ncbi:hypothetical protein, partial [Methanoregula sp.]|uniref:hypothetical protein n=1 Tax=Methanoregula sp. TaxID=2052170 RepID=UPI002601D8B2
LAEDPILTSFKKDFADIIRKHAGLREIQNRRQQKLLKEKISEEVFSLPTMQKLVSMSPALAQILIEGGRISSPFKLGDVGEGKKFNGERFPTYFKLIKEYPQTNPKHCPINQEKFLIQFETDVVNDYFDRSLYPGSFELSLNNKDYPKRSISLYNGIATLAIEVPKGVQIGDINELTFSVTDEHRYDDPFTSKFYVLIDKEKKENKQPGKPTPRPNPPGNDNGDRKEPEKFSIPEPRPIYKDQWPRWEFDENTAMHVLQREDKIDYLINMDNKVLLTELKANKKFDEMLLKQIYVDGMMIFTLLLVKEINKKENKNGISISNIKDITKMIAPGLIPIVLGFSKELSELYNL